MFLSYKHIRQLGYDKKTYIHSHEYEIADSEWVEVVVGVDAVTTIVVIDAYEKRELPVASNLFLAFQCIAKQCGWTIEQLINHNKQHNPKYLKYEPEIQKYLMLL